MNLLKFLGKKKGLINSTDFLDDYIRVVEIAMDMNFIRLTNF